MHGHRIDYIAPISRAWERMVNILFRPFDLVKWLAIGFTAWLATLLEGGSARGGGGSGGGDSFDSETIRQSAEGIWDSVGSFFESVGTIVMVFMLAAVILGIIALLVALTWLSCRGKFMFLDNVLANRAEIAEPWTRFGRQGNSLFAWTILFGIGAVILILAVVGIGVLAIVPFAQGRRMVGLALGGGLSAGLVFVGLLVVLGYVSLCLNDFVVPIMHRNGTGILAGWGALLELLNSHFWFFVLYGLLRFIFASMLGLALLTAFLIGCCCCCCVTLVFVIPYVGTVLLLPVHVFIRALGPEYLGELDNRYSLHRPPPLLPRRP